MQEQILFSLPLDRVEPIFKNWFRDVLSETQPQAITVREDMRLYGDKSAADYLGCSVLTIQKLRKTGEISFYRYGRKYYYISSELDAALKVDQRKFGKLPKSTSQTR